MDYNNPLNKGIDQIKKVSLSDTEKKAMLHRLHAYVDGHPVAVHQSWFAYATAFAAFVLMIGGGVSIAAEKSLPGDLLYPFKIHINEAIQGTLQSASEREERKMVKRLDEVQALVERGDFDTAKRAQVEKEVEKSVKTIDRTRSRDFENKIDWQLEKINKTSDMKDVEKPSQKEEVRQLVEKVKKRVRSEDHGRDELKGEKDNTKRREN